jgi:pimeloyl-ACP methyl ester carboxylesterase
MRSPADKAGARSELARMPGFATERLLYVHGSGATQDCFRAQVEAFPGSDALSLPGHPEGEALTSVGELADWLEKYVRWKGVSRAVVAGHSLGGAIAIEWALRYPSAVGGLILIGTGARLRVSPEIFDMLDNRWPECIDTLADRAMSSTGPELRERFKAWHVAVGQKTTRQDFSACNGFDLMPRLGEISAPTLIVVGTEDKMTPPKYSHYLHDHIAGSSLREVAGAGHLVMVEQPAAVNAAMREFLARLG